MKAVRDVLRLSVRASMACAKCCTSSCCWSLFLFIVAAAVAAHPDRAAESGARACAAGRARRAARGRSVRARDRRSLRPGTRRKRCCAIWSTRSRRRRTTSASRCWCWTWAAWRAAASRSWKSSPRRSATFAPSGKKVIAFGEGYDQSQYYVAAQRRRDLSRPAGPRADRRLRLLPHVPEGRDRQARQSTSTCSAPASSSRTRINSAARDMSEQEERREPRVAERAVDAVPGGRHEGARARGRARSPRTRTNYAAGRARAAWRSRRRGARARTRHRTQDAARSRRTTQGASSARTKTSTPIKASRIGTICRAVRPAQGIAHRRRSLRRRGRAPARFSMASIRPERLARTPPCACCASALRR